jgi:hypothetical protein
MTVADSCGYMHGLWNRSRRWAQPQASDGDGWCIVAASTHIHTPATRDKSLNNILHPPAYYVPQKTTYLPKDEVPV